MEARKQRCTAHVSDGSRPCQRWAIDGATVCATHGGRAPQVKKSARERLAELVEPALRGLNKALKSDDLPTIVRASQIVLDRCGFHPSKAIELSGKGGGPIQTQDPIDTAKMSLPLKRALVAELEAIQEGADFNCTESPFMVLKEDELDKWNQNTRSRARLESL